MRVLYAIFRESLQAAYDMVMDWTMEEHEALRSEVPKSALQTPFQNGTVQDIAKKVSAHACALLW